MHAYDFYVLNNVEMLHFNVTFNVAIFFF